MALGRRRCEQQVMWVATTELPRSPGHVFYEKPNDLLEKAGFDAFVEKLCAPYYARGVGRPSIPPGVDFRMLLVGYFEGIDSQQGIAWRCSESLSLRQFLGIALTERTPDHSSMTKIRQRLPEEVFAEVFSFVLAMTGLHKLLKGKTLGVDSSMLEANAAMKSIVRRERGGARRCWLRGLAEVRKRYLMVAAAYNLGVIMRKVFGFAKPRSAWGLSALLCFARFASVAARLGAGWLSRLRLAFKAIPPTLQSHWTTTLSTPTPHHQPRPLTLFSTGC